MIEGRQTDEAETFLTYGMVGGGEGAFIGDVHRKSIALDGKANIVCGCFSRDHDNTLKTGTAIGIAKNRLYSSYEEMAKQEGTGKEGIEPEERSGKIDFVVIVTPNFTHYPIAKAFLEKNINVVCDKPLTITSSQAKELKELATKKGLTFCVTYTYTGYPVVKHARAMIKNGDLGQIRFINAEYLQDWSITRLAKTGQKKELWRMDPEKSGPSNCVGDIGSHIENIISYMTNLKIQSLSARLDKTAENRKLDDNATIMVNYNGGAKGLYWCSQIAVGNDNGLRVRIFGSKASIEWAQENPNYLKISYLDKPTQIISRGRDALYPVAQSFSRIPPGHPEGYFEAFANVYKAFASFLLKKKQGKTILDEDLDFPGAAQGEEGVKFIERCVTSSDTNSSWIEMD